jgi:hypothetical protein
VAMYREENGYTLVPMHLAPEGSMFVVFRDTKQEKHIQRLEKDGVPVWPEFSLPVGETAAFAFERNEGGITASVSQPGNYIVHWSDKSVSSFTADEPLLKKRIAGEWKMKFLSHWGPQEEVVADTLGSWSDSPDEAIKFYSGKVEYSNSFDLSSTEISGRRVFLDLGNVQEIASLKVNGKDAGITWIAPFRHDITGLITEGTNHIVVTVVNSWVNRLIGDGGKPPEERFTRTNVLKFEGDNRMDFIRKSGLVSDASLLVSQEISVQ